MLGANIKKSFEKGICDFGDFDKKEMQQKTSDTPQLQRCWKNKKDYFYRSGGVCQKAKTCSYADCPHIK